MSAVEQTFEALTPDLTKPSHKCLEYLGAIRASFGEEGLSRFNIFAHDKWYQVPEVFIYPFGSSGSFSVDEAGELTGVKIGNCGSNPDKTLKIIANIATLKRLVINSNSPLSIPEELASAPHLSYLWLNGQISRVPERLFRPDFPINVKNNLKYDSRAEKIENLLYNRDHLLEDAMAKNLKKEIPQMHGIRMATETSAIQSPYFQILSKELAALRGMYFAEDVRLEDPPFEVVSKGYDAIKNYFSERKSGVRLLNELKLILVGGGGAGKTSLVKRICGGKFNAKEPQTHGINIRKGILDVPGGQSISLNYWDFGGQEIMHATHQFFLSKRSAYILVLDGRKDEDPEYWMQHIVSFGGDSPVFVVLNKIDEHPSADVNRRFLAEKYRSIVGFFRVSCAKDSGIDELKLALVRELPAVPMLKTPWPIHWFDVKGALEAQEAPYVSLDEYQKICRRLSVSELKNQDLLVDFLHDLGVVVHFKDLQLLDTHVLDPRWVTEGVYRILNSSALAKGRGLLDMDSVGGILNKKSRGSFDYPRDKHGFIIELMLKFELCYKVDDSLVLVPDLLDIQEPEFARPSGDSLSFVFCYEYLPRSVMPKLIVRLHGDIYDNLKWRTGAVFSEPSMSSKALVRADYKACQIRVEVWGGQARDYFSVIRKAVADINSLFERLVVTECMPLPGFPNTYVDYQELIGHERAGRSELFVGKLDQIFDVQKLLNGVESKAARDARYGSILSGNHFSGNTTIVTNSNASVNQAEVKSMSKNKVNWDKVCATISAFFVIGTVLFISIRNEPISDPNIVVMLRVMLSLSLAVFGAVIPGFLHVSMSAKGLVIRSAGALAVFVLSYVVTPRVISATTQADKTAISSP